MQSKLKEAIFEPKMTRSKLREVVENGQMPVSLHTFMYVLVGDNSDNDDYNVADSSTAVADTALS